MFKRMKICLFTSSIDKNNGGPSRSVPILAKGLSLVGIDTTLFTCRSHKMNTHLLDNSDVTLRIVPSTISFDELEKEILSGNYDLIHGQNLWDPLYCKMAKIARKYSIPYIMTPRGCLEPWCLCQKKWKKRIAMALYQKHDLQKAACILATSDMETAHIRELGITSPIATIPNGIDISEYQCRSVDFKNSIKNQIVFISRIHQKKGIEVLIRAWERLSRVYPEWNIVIAGNGEDAYIQQLKNLIKINGLDKVVDILPPVFGEAKHMLYCESSLFVLPSYSENFGMVIAEAMSCGVPVITTKGTPWQDLNDKEIGWCIELSVDNLADAISNAIDLGQDALFDMGQKASQYIRDTYQYTEVAYKNKAVYEWIVNGTSKPNYVGTVDTVSKSVSE